MWMDINLILYYNVFVHTEYFRCARRVDDKTLTELQVQRRIIINAPSTRYRRTVPCPVRPRRRTTSRRQTLVTESPRRNPISSSRSGIGRKTSTQSSQSQTHTTRRIKKWKKRTSSFIRRFCPARGWTVCRKAPVPPACRKRPSTKTNRNTDTTTRLYRRYVPVVPITRRRYIKKANLFQVVTEM